MTYDSNRWKKRFDITKRESSWIAPKTRPRLATKKSYDLNIKPRLICMKFAAVSLKLDTRRLLNENDLGKKIEHCFIYSALISQSKTIISPKNTIISKSTNFFSIKFKYNIATAPLLPSMKNSASNFTIRGREKFWKIILLSTLQRTTKAGIS